MQLIYLNFLKIKKKEKELKELNGEIEIDLKKIKVPMSEKN